MNIQFTYPNVKLLYGQKLCSISNIQSRQRVVIKTEKKEGNKINGETFVC